MKMMTEEAIANAREDARQDFFMALSYKANEKDIATHGPNEPDTMRDLAHVTLEMHEVLDALISCRRADEAKGWRADV